MYKFQKILTEDSDILSSEDSILFEKITKKYKNIYVIISPPRCSSTVFARVFWEHPLINFYCHEPFDLIYHKGLKLTHALQAIECPLSLENINKNKLKENNLVIKEMTFQSGYNLHFFAALTKHPLIFVIRDPRLAISSRMIKLTEGGQNPIFPLIESGWTTLDYQIQKCKQLNISYIIVDAKDFRENPNTMFKKIFKRIELSFSSNILSWKSMEEIDLGNLGYEQKHWYKRILSSTGIEAAIEPIPKISYFPKTHGFRSHIVECLKIYKNLKNDINIICI